MRIKAVFLYLISFAIGSVLTFFYCRLPLTGLFQKQLLRPPLQEKYKSRQEVNYFWASVPENIKLHLREKFPEARDFVVCEADLVPGLLNEFAVSFSNGERGPRETLVFERNIDRSLKDVFSVSEFTGEHFELVCRHAILEMRHPDFKAHAGAEGLVDLLQKTNFEVIRVREFQGAVYSFVGYDRDQKRFVFLGKRSVSQ